MYSLELLIIGIIECAIIPIYGDPVTRKVTWHEKQIEIFGT
jgi:hypothetical protein